MAAAPRDVYEGGGGDRRQIANRKSKEMSRWWSDAGNGGFPVCQPLFT